MRLIDISPYEDCKIVLHDGDPGFKVSTLPTVDAEPVVRCADCKHWESIYFMSDCKMHNLCGKHATETGEDFYCADGRRRDDETD